MTTLPLTHHSIVRITSPLSRLGLKVNLANSDRSTGYIEFVSQQEHDGSTVVVHVLEVAGSSEHMLTRIAAHDSGLVSTIQCSNADVAEAFLMIDQVPLERQMNIRTSFGIAHSFTVKSSYSATNTAASLQSRFVCVHVAALELRLDTSIGAGMPADVRILSIGQNTAYVRDTLADGGGIPLHHRAAKATRREAADKHREQNKILLPDDILAVLGTQWRPLRAQGDHWKGVLRCIENPKIRTQRIEKFVEEAAHHVLKTLQCKPTTYHDIYAKQRWRVYFRRLQPVMVFIGILMLMPMSWLFVSSGAMTIHPLALGLTPLLMVGVVVLTAREIPVMEIPPRPSHLPDSAWNALDVSE